MLQFTGTSDFMKSGLSKFFTQMTNEFPPSTSWSRKQIFLNSFRARFLSCQFKLSPTNMFSCQVKDTLFILIFGYQLFFSSFGSTFTSAHFQSSSNIHTLFFFLHRERQFLVKILAVKQLFFNISGGHFSSPLLQFPI